MVQTSYRTAGHVLCKIHHCTFRSKYFLDDFLYPETPKNVFRPLKIRLTVFLVIDHKTVFRLLSTTLPYFP